MYPCGVHIHSHLISVAASVFFFSSFTSCKTSNQTHIISLFLLVSYCIHYPAEYLHLWCVPAVQRDWQFLTQQLKSDTVPGFNGAFTWCSRSSCLVNNTIFMWIAKKNCRWGNVLSCLAEVDHSTTMEPRSKTVRDKSTRRPAGSIAVQLEVWNNHPHTFNFPASVEWSWKMWNSNHVVLQFWSCAWDLMVDEQLQGLWTQWKNKARRTSVPFLLHYN